MEIFAIMRRKIGTMSPYDFLDAKEKYRATSVVFWNRTTAAYSFCMEEQRFIVADAISQTLDRLTALLERENA